MPFGASTQQQTQGDWRCPTCRLATRASAGMLSLPNNPLIVTAMQAICSGGEGARLSDGGWRQTREGFPYYEFWSGSGGRIGVRIAREDPAEAWRVVEGMSALTLDTAAAILCGLCAPPFRSTTRAPRRASVRLGAPAVLAAKTYTRYGAERSTFAKSISEELERVLLLRFDILNYPGFSPKLRAWNRAGVTRTDVKLIEASEDWGSVDPLECSMGRPLQLGAWADHWLNAGGPMWVSPLPQAILALDHRENRGADLLAKKTALLLALNWGALKRGKTIETDVRTLLRRIGELRRPSAETLQHSGRFADRFEEALFRLADGGLMDITLLGETAAVSRSRGRRWFDTWLESAVIIRRPNFLEAAEAAAPSTRAEA